MSHPDEETLLLYVSDQASDQMSFEVAGHIADCRECLERARGLTHLRENFDSLWDSWTAEEHGSVGRQWRLATALEAAAGSDPSLAGKVAASIKSLEQSAQIGLKVLLDRAKRLSALAAGSMPEGFGCTPRFAFAGVGAPDEQAEEHLKRGAELLDRGEVEEAIAELEGAAKVDARLPQAASSEVQHGGQTKARIDADSRRGYLSVRFWPAEGEKAPELVVLMPEGRPEAARAAELLPVRGEDYLLAEFEELPTGQFEILW